MSDAERDKPDLTIVGGQPKRRLRKGSKVQVPVGLEKALYLAAQDDEFKTRLLADPAAFIAEQGIELRPSELATVSAISPAVLESMIDRLVPENPRRRKFMGLVAAAAASLAAGTAVISCDDDIGKGIGPDTDIDGDTDTDTDGDTDSDTETETDTETGTDTD